MDWEATTISYIVPLHRKQTCHFPHLSLPLLPIIVHRNTPILQPYLTRKTLPIVSSSPSYLVSTLYYLAPRVSFFSCLLAIAVEFISFILFPFVSLLDHPRITYLPRMLLSHRVSFDLYLLPYLPSTLFCCCITVIARHIDLQASSESFSESISTYRPLRGDSPLVGFAIPRWA